MSSSSTSIAKPIFSSVFLYLGEVNLLKKPLPSPMIRASAQFVSSLMGSRLGDWFHRMFPGSLVTGILGESLLVSVSTNILVSIVEPANRTMKVLRFSVLYSFLAELGASWIYSPGGLMDQTTSQTTVTAGIAAPQVAYSAGSRSTTGAPAW